VTEPLRVAIVHYHLRTGGVTRVIANAVRALTERGVVVVVLAAGPAGVLADAGGAVQAIEALDYDSPRAPSLSGDTLAAMLREAARRHFGCDPDVWHVHNHSLGKNCALPRALLRLGAEGAPLLLQIHDFPEDGRPDNYRALRSSLGVDASAAFGGTLYPRAPHIHYAVLNNRDREFLLRAGADDGNVHRIANPVSIDATSELAPSPNPGDRFFLYPTRAIRRKNLGEFLLWAAAAGPGDRFGVTLAPTSAADLPPYRQWRALAARLRLPVEFELGLREGATWRHLIEASTCTVTTSVAEGFGLAFLEPWLADRPIAGRDLPEITADFAHEGIALGGLYARLDVPAEWIDARALRRTLGEALPATYAAYGRACPPDAVERALRVILSDDRADFGRLDTALQARVVERVASAPTCRTELRPAALAVADAAAVSHNRRRIEERYALEAYGRTLQTVYRAAASERRGPIGALDAERILDQFLAPERFSLLRT
jgi:glycosyltransferase involved in cell wall biosynthesis